MGKQSYFLHEKGMCESTQVGENTRIWACAHVSEGAVVGSGCNIGEGCFIEAGAKIGNHCIIKNGVSVWDKVTLEDYVFLGPYAVLTNDYIPRAKYKKAPEDFLPTLIKEGASVGANATIVCGVTLGKASFVGAGAVVTKDVPDYAVVYGNPAKQHGWVCECGKPLPRRFDAAQCDCGLNYRMTEGKVTLT